MRLHKKLIAGLLAFNFSVAQAGPADLITTPFTGPGIVATDLETAVASFTNLPWSDPDGRSYTANTSSGISPNFGLNINNGIWTMSNLGPNVTKVGWYWTLNFGTLNLSSVSFSNGDSYSVLTPVTTTNSFIGFESSTPFTSVSMTFTGGSSGRLTDFITQAVVPEPSTIISSLVCMLCVGLMAYRKQRGRKLVNA